MCQIVVTGDYEAPNVGSRQASNTNSGAFSARLREVRRELGLTQAEFAAKAGVSTNTQNRYETGAISPTTDYLERIDHLGADVVF